MRRTSHTTCGALFGALCLARAVGATELEWSAPGSCSQDAFVQQVEDNLERPLAELTLERIAVTVAEHEDAEWTLEFTLGDEGTGASPSRKLTGASCADVSRAGAVAVAMAIHSRAAEERAAAPAREPVAEPPVSDENERPSQPESVESAAASDKGTPGPPFHWPVQLLLLGDLSLLGTPSYGVGAGVGVARGRWEGTLSAAILPAVELRTSDTLGLTLGASIGMLTGCYSLGGPPATPRVCLGYEFGVVDGKGTGSGLLVKREQRALWHALRPELGLGIPLGAALELRLFAGVAFALSQASFVFDAGRVAHELPRISGRGSVSLAWIL